MLRPTQDYIVIRPIERVQSTIIEVVSNEKQCRGVVLAVGPGKYDKRGVRRPLEAQIGDVVIFGDGNFDFYPKYFDDKSDTLEPQPLRIIQEADIVGIILHQGDGNALEKVS